MVKSLLVLGQGDCDDSDNEGDVGNTAGKEAIEDMVKCVMGLLKDYSSTAFITEWESCQFITSKTFSGQKTRLMRQMTLEGTFLKCHSVECLLIPRGSCFHGYFTCVFPP